jgi:hypothetical protein
MPITTIVQNSFKSGQFNGGAINVTAATIKYALFTNASNISATTVLYSSLTHEVSGTGYSTGGNSVTLTAKVTNPANPIFLASGSAQWTGASFTARYGALYDTVTSKIIRYDDYGGDQTVTAGTFTVQFDNTNGVLNITSD